MPGGTPPEAKQKKLLLQHRTDDCVLEVLAAVHLPRCEQRVQSGDTVADLMQRLNINDPAASDFLRNRADAKSFRKLSNGKEVQAETDVNGALISLRYLGEQGVQMVIKKQGNSFTSKAVSAQLEKRLFVRTGEIKTSLYAATDAAGMPESAGHPCIFGSQL